MHVHTMTTAEPGIDQCTDCTYTVHNAYTARDVLVEDCPCGRGPARFLDSDGTAHCEECFEARVRGEVHA